MRSHKKLESYITNKDAWVQSNKEITAQPNAKAYHFHLKKYQNLVSHKINEGQA